MCNDTNFACECSNGKSAVYPVHLSPIQINQCQLERNDCDLDCRDDISESESLRKCQDICTIDYACGTVDSSEHKIYFTIVPETSISTTTSLEMSTTTSLSELSTLSISELSTLSISTSILMSTTLMKINGNNSSQTSTTSTEIFSTILGTNEPQNPKIQSNDINVDGIGFSSTSQRNQGENHTVISIVYFYFFLFLQWKYTLV